MFLFGGPKNLVRFRGCNRKHFFVYLESSHWDSNFHSCFGRYLTLDWDVWTWKLVLAWVVTSEAGWISMNQKLWRWSGRAKGLVRAIFWSRPIGLTARTVQSLFTRILYFLIKRQRMSTHISQKRNASVILFFGGNSPSRESVIFFSGKTPSCFLVTLTNTWRLGIGSLPSKGGQWRYMACFMVAER